jgi:hypothetical protein
LVSEAEGSTSLRPMCTTLHRLLPVICVLFLKVISRTPR